MDLLYGVWSDRTKAAVDAVTICFLIFYLIVLLGGGISSTQYALQYNAVSPTLWRPQLAPIKIIMCIGIFLMLLQAIATQIGRASCRERGFTDGLISVVAVM